MDVLLLGCGRLRVRNITRQVDKPDFSSDNLTTIDIDPASKPDIVMDLGDLPSGGRLPFPDESFDEIHAYDFLEHIGTQGDWRGFFTEFGEYHRVLRDNGLFFILVPIGGDAFGDPGHTRFFHQNHFAFLSQKFNKKEPEPPSSHTDYSWYWKKNFEITLLRIIQEHHLAVILRKT